MNKSIIATALLTTVLTVGLTGCMPENMNDLQQSLMNQGAASTGTAETQLKAWEGETVGNLYAVYGEPNKTVSAPDGDKIYTYIKQEMSGGDNPISSLVTLFDDSNKTKQKINEMNAPKMKKCVINFKADKAGKINVASIVENNKTMFGSDCDSLIKPAP